MNLKIIDIDNRKYILCKQGEKISIYNSDGTLTNDGCIIGKVFEKYLNKSLEEKIENAKIEKYLVYDEYGYKFNYKIMDLKYVGIGRYYDEDGELIDPDLLIEFKADEETKKRVREREEKVFDYEQKIEEINDSFYDFIDKKRKDYEQNKGDK